MTTQTEREVIAPEICIAYIDESEHITDPELLARTGRWWGVYLYNRKEATHCCEVTPSYWLELVGYYVEREIDDATQEELVSILGQDMQDSSGGHYYHCHSVDAWHMVDRAILFAALETASADTLPVSALLETVSADVTGEDAMEGVAEYVRGNGYTVT